MDVPVSLIISLVLLLVAAAGGSSTTNVKTPAEYWQSVLPEIDMPQAILDQLTPHAGEDNLKEVSVSYGTIQENDLKEVSVTYGTGQKQNLKEVSVSYGTIQENDLKQVSVSYGTSQKQNLKEVSVSYGTTQKQNLKEVSVSYGTLQENDLKEVSVPYGTSKKQNLKEVSVSYGTIQENDLKEVSVSYGTSQKQNLKEVSVSYGTIQENDLKQVSVSYGTSQKQNLKEGSVSYVLEEGKYRHNEVLNQVEEDPNEVRMVYGSEDGDDPNRATMSYRSEHEDDPHKATLSYGPGHEEDPHKATMSYGSGREEDPHKATMSYGSGREEDPHNATMSYGSARVDDSKTVSTEQATHTDVAGKGSNHHHVHVHAHSHNKKRQQAGVFFFHDMLRPGSIITPTIPPTTSLPTFLPYEVADSIPFSTDRLPEIISMFAPASLAMARDMRWTLDTCEHPRTLPGQKAGCATSLETLAELTTSLLRTRNVHAFSAANLPVEAPGTAALRGRYNVTMVRSISGDSQEVVTCHDLTYPYAVYYCHTSNPTAAYAVTLASVEGATGAPKTMEVMAVCHLDTSQWSPKNPFFELHSLKPGDVAVCHFLTKLSIIWVRGGDGEAHAMAR